MGAGPIRVLNLIHLHPAVVHFPIALFVTALGFDTACLVFRRQTWLDRATVALYLLGALGAGGAALTGKLAASGLSSLPDLPAEASLLIGDHGDWAFFTVVAFFVVSALRFDTFWRDRQRSTMGLHRQRLLSFAAGLVALGILFMTTDRGSALVYQHGLGVRDHLSGEP